MTTPSASQKLGLRPSTSHGCLLSTRPLARRRQPPCYLLPPRPPPPPLPQAHAAPLRLPNLPESHAKRLPRRTRPRHVPSNSSSSSSSRHVKKTDSATDTHEYQENIRYICRLCGFDCLSGDSLHAHLLLFRHSALNPSDTHLVCRQCGNSWRLEDENGEKRCRNHPCLLQKAAYFKHRLAPFRSLRQGLPFVCLFCCAEEVGANEPSKRPPRRPTKKVIPLKRCQAAARFTSKLELAVHIRYVHDPSRQPGRCSECYDFVGESGEPPELEFWDVPAPSRQLRPHSTDSLLYREGLSPLEVHVQENHMESYEYLQWLNSKRHRNGPGHHAEDTLKTSAAWMYSCPLCQLTPSGEHLVGGAMATRPEVGLPSNASLQAHLACFHAAGSTLLDWKFHSCAVCGELGIVSPQSHLLKRKHVARLKDCFSRALKQGRFAAVEGAEVVDWRTTCVLCWRKFAVGGEVHLRAECRLQTHLLSTHCIFSPISGGEFNVLACGWCGGLRGPEARRQTAWMQETDEDGFGHLRGIERLQARRRRGRAHLFADFRWFRRHEEEHADSLFRWWKANDHREDADNCRRGLLWSRGSWRDL